ncbi:hypothetical protein H8959_003940 [Pygathrix nigripes]
MQDQDLFGAGHGGPEGVPAAGAGRAAVEGPQRRDQRSPTCELRRRTCRAPGPLLPETLGAPCPTWDPDGAPGALGPERPLPPPRHRDPCLGRPREEPLSPVPASLRCPGCPIRGGSSEQWNSDVPRRHRDPPEQGQGCGGRAQTPASGRGRSCPWGA